MVYGLQAYQIQEVGVHMLENGKFAFELILKGWDYKEINVIIVDVTDLYIGQVAGIGMVEKLTGQAMRHAENENMPGVSLWYQGLIHFNELVKPYLQAES